MRLPLAGIPILLVASCSGQPVEEGLFFPTWNANGPVPSGQVQGLLIESNRCLFLEAHGQRTLVVWETGLGFEDGALLGTDGGPIARVGETIHGGGGYFGDQGHIANLAGEPVPERCIPYGDGDRFALIYEVGVGPVE